MAITGHVEQWGSYLVPRVVVKPIPPEQHPETFTGARAGLVAVGVIFSLIGIFAIVCRVITIVQRRRKMGYDDYAMFAAFVCATGFTIAVFVSVRWGVGLNVEDVPVYWARRAIQAIYTDEVFYYMTIFCIKLSLIFLYLRLAAELRGWFYYASVSLLVVLVLHFMTTLVVVSTQCLPIQKYWNPSMPGTCINITAFFYSTNIFTIVTDIIMIALPIPIIMKIPGERKQKLAILAAFLVASGGTIASCVRLYSIRVFTESRQPMRDAAPISTWSFIEVNLGILCASSAVIRPLFSKSQAPSLRRRRKITPPADVRYTIGRSGRVRTTISGDLKDMSRWSISQSSTAVATSPDTMKSMKSMQTSDRDVEMGRDEAPSPESTRLPEPAIMHHNQSRNRADTVLLPKVHGGSSSSNADITDMLGGSRPMAGW